MNFTAYYNCPLGQVEIQTTNDAVVSVRLCNEMNAPRDNHQSSIINQKLQECIRQLEEYFSGRRTQKMQLGEPDASGRRRPVVIEGSEFAIDVDTVIVSIGVSPNPLIAKALPSLETTRWGTITVNQETMQTSVPDIFAGGDIVRGGATVILAMGDGRRAAEGMNKYLQSLK